MKNAYICVRVSVFINFASHFSSGNNTPHLHITSPVSTENN